MLCDYEQKVKRYERLLLECNGSIVGFCVSHTEDREDADDLAQEIFAAVWDGIDGLRSDNIHQQRRWLKRVMLTSLARHLRQRFKHTRLVDDIDMADIVADHREAVDELTERLTPGERALLERHLEGYTYAEIARREGVSETSVARRMASIKQKMIETRKEKYGN